MNTLKAEKRNKSTKAKKLRRDGHVTNVIKLRHWDARTFEVGHTKNVCPVFFL